MTAVPGPSQSRFSSDGEEFLRVNRRRGGGLDTEITPSEEINGRQPCHPCVAHAFKW